MKKWTFVLAALLAISARGSWASGGFEGEVDMKMTTHNGKTMMVQYFVKGHKMRTQMESQDEKFSGGAIYDVQTNQVTVLMDKQKMYMVNQLHPENFHYGTDKHFKLTKTGKTLDILGHTATEWDYTSDDDNGKIWMAPGIGNWWAEEMAAQADKMPSEQRSLVKAAIEEKLFPLKWESNDKSGQEKAGMEAVKLEKKSLSSSMFEPPAGYKKFDMGNLLGGNAKLPF